MCGGRNYVRGGRIWIAASFSLHLLSNPAKLPADNYDIGLIIFILAVNSCCDTCMTNFVVLLTTAMRLIGIELKAVEVNSHILAES